MEGTDIVVIVIDTLRADRLSFYGHERITSPFLDALAEECVLFEEARSASSWTAPATASLFTGLHPDQHGVVTGLKISKRIARSEAYAVNRIPPDRPTLPELMQSAGYRTFGVADNPNICDAMGFARGFDEFASFDYEGGERVNEVLEAWLPDLEADEPTFLYLHYMDPHVPYGARAPWYEEPAGGDDGSREARLARYDSEIGYVDARIAEVFEWLDLRRDALVVITSDHGEEFMEHGSWDHSFQLYDELLHVPFLIRGPDGGPLEPRRIAEPVSTLDLLPTLAGLVGLPLDVAVEGQDLSPALLDPEFELPADRAIHAMRTEELKRTPQTLHAVVQGGVKAIVRDQGAEVELYDLREDPDESADLARRRPRLRAELTDATLAFERRLRLAERSFSDPITLDDEKRKTLERLGYVDEGE